MHSLDCGESFIQFPGGSLNFSLIDADIFFSYKGRLEIKQCFMTINH